MPRKKTNFEESALLNNLTYNLYWRKLSDIAISRFVYKGLPDSIDPRFLEVTLFERGAAVLFVDEVLGPLALPVIANGPFDVYRYPIVRTAIADNGYQAQLDKTNSVMIYNNRLRTPSEKDVKLYARRLYEIERTIDVNVKAQKTPVMVKATEEQKLSMLQVYQKYDGNQAFIFCDKGLDPQAIQVLQTEAPYVSDRLYDLKTQIWNEALTHLGVANVSFEKRERLTNEEVTRHMGGIFASRSSFLEERQKAMDAFTKMFNLDPVTVEFNEGVLSDENPETDYPEEEGGGEE